MLKVVLYLVATVTAIQLQARPLSGTSAVTLGTFTKTGFEQSIFLPIGQDYCIGSQDLDDHECFGVFQAQKADELVHFVVYSADGEKIDRILLNSVAESPIVTILSPGVGPVPNMKPAISAAKKPVKKAGQKSAVEGAESEGNVDGEGEEGDTEDDKSFIQK